MASLDGSLKSIIQGVSQQVPRERLDGQVSKQVNMLSDPVQGMRRRPGMRLQNSGLFSGSTQTTRIFATVVDIDDQYVHVLINTVTGALVVLSSTWATLHTSTWPYLIASSADRIQVSSLRGFLYIANTDQQPGKVVANTTKINPLRSGFYYVMASAYSKKYMIYVTVNGSTYGGTYVVPDGTHAGDADKATPDYVASSLLTSLRATLPASVLTDIKGPYVSVLGPVGSTVTVTSDAGSTYVGASNQSHVTLVSNLPANLPAAANGFMMAVGADLSRAAWYTYNFTDNQWVESGDYTSATSISNMPMRLKLDSTYLVEQPVYEGRLAGNDTTNEDPAFIADGITGLAAFQGRLVILSGPTICMSASGKPLRWYRSTVTDLLVADAISIFSGAASSANFTHAVQFNKDLLLFSKTCQAVVPSGNAIIAPSTAQIVITSGYAATVKAPPIVAGRSLLYFSPRSEGFSGALEMIPSSTTDSQYTSNDVTAHIPRYLPGDVRQATASPTSNSLVLVCEGDPNSIFIQEYLWSGDEKVQSAWHKWTAAYPVVCTWFVRDAVYVGLQVGTSMTVVSLEPQANDLVNGLHRPFSDLFDPITVTDGQFVVPERLRPAYTTGTALLLTYATGSMAGELAGITHVDAGTWLAHCVRNTPDGVYQLGLAYNSEFAPTPPALRDRNGVVIGTGDSTLIRYELTMRNVGRFKALVTGGSRVISDIEYGGLVYADTELELNQALFASTARVNIPVRFNSQESETVLSTAGVHDMGILTVEYVMQYHARRQRA